MKNTSLQLFPAGLTFCGFCLHSFSKLLPWLPDYLSSFISFSYPSILPLSALSIFSLYPESFPGDTYSSLLISSKETHFPCSQLISLQISQILCAPSLAQALATNYSPSTRILHFSLSFLCKHRIHATLFHH